MARNNARPAPPAPHIPPRPTRDRVQHAFQRGELQTAYTAARLLHANEPTAEHLKLLKQMLAAAAGVLADRNQTSDFNKVMDEADRLDPENAEWAAERALLLARGGRLADALIRADEATRPRVLAHAADRAVRFQSKEFLPDELHAGFDAVITGFAHYEAGRDEECRAALDAIGLRSPFLEWKLLLRGLTACATGDAARAAENFSRLDSHRIPARLAAPYRFQTDPAWKAQLLPAAAGELQKQLEKLTTGPMLDRLREVARHLGRNGGTRDAFRAAEGLVPLLKAHDPDLLPRLAECVYHAIPRVGEPNDLARFHTLFGKPADDPDFFRLQALIAEDLNHTNEVHTFWLKYESWLATNPPGWPADILGLARSAIWQRLGKNALHSLDEVEEDVDLFASLQKLKTKPKPKPVEPDSLTCFRKAVELAPTNEEAVRLLYRELETQKLAEEAERVVRKFLEHRPDAILPLTALGNQLLEQGRSDEAVVFFQRALVLNPLDKLMLRRNAIAIEALARKSLASGDAAKAESLFRTHENLFRDYPPTGMLVLRAVALRKLGFSDAAAEQERIVRGAPQVRLETAYRFLVESQLAKLKPAEKKLADQLYAAAIADTPRPAEVALMMAAYECYTLQGVVYRGQKTHKTKHLDLCLRTVESDARVEEFELLAEGLEKLAAWKHLKKYTDACLRKFPKNPLFLLLRAVVGLELNENVYRVELKLSEAKRLAAASPTYQNLVPRIDELLREVATPFDFLDHFFHE